MSETLYVVINNLVLREKREISVYHHGTRGAHLISPNSSVKLPLRMESKGDYLHISPVMGPGFILSRWVVCFPGFLTFECDIDRKLSVRQGPGETCIKIPPGAPNWHVKVMLPPGTARGNGLVNVTVTEFDDDVEPVKGPGRKHKVKAQREQKVSNKYKEKKDGKKKNNL